MKTKTFALIASMMVFGTALLTGIVVIAILFLSNNDNLPVARTNQNNEGQQITELQADFVYLFDGSNLNLMRVSLNGGTNQQFSLGLPNDESTYVYRLAFSDDGRMVAFCSNHLAGDTMTSRLIVRDIAAESTVLDIPFGQIPGCETSAFSEDGTQVAVGIVFNDLFMNAINYPDEPNWTLRVYDIASGTIAHELSANSDIAPDYESMRTTFWFEEGISAMTRAVHVTDTEVLFTAYPFVGRDGASRVPAHRWDLVNNTLTPIHALTLLGANYLPTTGEIVYPELDESFPAAAAQGPMPLANTIRVDSNGEVRTIYRNENAVIATTTFISGGEQIAARCLPGCVENTPNAIGAPYYEIINRDGSVGQVSSNFFSYNQLHGTANGLIMLSQSHLGEQGNEYHLVTYTNGESNIIWRLIVPPNEWYDLAWTPSMPVSSNLPDFAVIN